MLEINIKLNSIEEAQRFVAATTSLSCDITIESGDFIADAKSILGVLGLDLTKPLTIRCDEAYSGEVKRVLHDFLWHSRN